MNPAIKILGFSLLCAAMNAALAQQPPTPPKASAQSEAGEPRADTSPVPESTKSPEAPAAAPAPKAKSTANRPAAAGQKAAPPTNDRLELGTATVTGDREQPKVMYIVPWKRSDMGDLAGKPMNSLVDEILAPVDREVFKREVLYHKAVQAEASQNGASHPSQQGEK